LGGEVHFAEAVVVDTAMTEALALQAHHPDDEDSLLLVEAPLESLSLVRSVVA
jgi:hypothetical protein